MNEIDEKSDLIENNANDPDENEEDEDDEKYESINNHEVNQDLSDDFEEDDEPDLYSRTTSRIKKREPIKRFNRSHNFERILPEPAHTDAETVNNDSNRKVYYRWIIPMVLVLLAATAAAAISDELNVWKIIFDKWNGRRERNDALVQEFLAQNNQTIPKIGCQMLKKVLEKADSSEMDSSMILLLIADPRQNSILKNISRELATLVFKMNDKNPLNVNIAELDRIDQSKTIVDLYVKTFLEENEPVMIWENLQSINPLLAPTFHQFVDDNQSVISSSFSIMTLTSHFDPDQNISSNMTIKEVHTITTRTLEKLWKHSLPPEDLTSLNNRIGRYSIVILQD